MSTVSQRLAALREAMAAAGVAAYLIPTGDPHASEYLPAHYNSREYFSGFTGENSTLVVTRTASALWADGRFFVQAEKELAGTEIQLMRMGEPNVPTVEQYCADALQEGEAAGLAPLPAGLEEAVAVAQASTFLHKVLPEELAGRYYEEQLRRCAELRAAADPAEYERARWFGVL